MKVTIIIDDDITVDKFVTKPDPEDWENVDRVFIAAIERAAKTRGLNLALECS